MALLAFPAAALRGGEAEEAYHRAVHALDTDLDAAIRQLDDATRLDPQQPRYRGLRGVAWIRKGEHAKGLADLAAAIRLNPRDAGVAYRPTSDATLADEALKHGRRQVEAMLRDRPNMNQYGQATDFLRQWAVRKFAGEDLGQIILWDSSSPLHSDAENIAPTNGEPGAILVEGVYDSGPNKGCPRSFEELWAGAVFELYNINYAKEFVRLNDEADEGKVSKKDFVAGIVKYEVLAAQQTRAFYVQVYLPWAEKQKLPSEPSLWFADWWPDAAQVLEGFTDHASYPWRPYGRQHDWATVHLRWRQGKFKEALKLLDEMRSEAGYEVEQADVQFWIGRCRLRSGEAAAALEALNEAIRLDPTSSAAHYVRGEVFRQLGKTKEADADFAKSKQLEAEEE